MSLGTTPSTFDIGRLRQRVRIQRDIGRQDSFGQKVPEWSDFAMVWACVEPLGGRELFQAQQVYPESDTSITIRYLDGVTTAMRVVWKDPRTQTDHQYDIKDLSDIENRHHVIAITAVERPIERNV